MYPELNLVVLIGSVRNTSRINYVFETYHPISCTMQQRISMCR